MPLDEKVIEKAHTGGTLAGSVLFEISEPTTPSMASTWNPVSAAASVTASNLSVRSLILMTKTFAN